MWRLGVDNSLDGVLEASENLCKDLTRGYDTFFPSDWEEGSHEGKEAAAEEIELMLREYKKENK
jgi:hypothetical protein